MRRLLALFGLMVGAAVAPATADAQIVERQDEAGRTITFDVRSAGVDVDWYAAILRGALHGNEIERVTVRIVEPSALRRECGRSAVACYGGTRAGGRIVVPAGRSNSLARTLLHEYAHHVDASRSVSGVAEPNGTTGWWRARSMGQRLLRGEVARTYSLGWERSIGEIYAEDYVQAHFGSAPYAIGWLSPPTSAVRRAIVADLGGTPPSIDLPGPDEAVPAPPETGAPSGPVSISRSGVLGPREAAAIPFGLLGPGRRVEVAVRASGSSVPGSRLRVEVVCASTVVAAKTLADGVRSVVIDRSRLGPAECRVVLRNTSSASLRVVVRLTLSVRR